LDLGAETHLCQLCYVPKRSPLLFLVTRAKTAEFSNFCYLESSENFKPADCNIVHLDCKMWQLHCEKFNGQVLRARDWVYFCLWETVNWQNDPLCEPVATKKRNIGAIAEKTSFKHLLKNFVCFLLKNSGKWRTHIVTQQIKMTFSLFCNKVDKRYRPVNIIDRV